jgi:hypothetical protein
MNQSFLVLGGKRAFDRRGHPDDLKSSFPRREGGHRGAREESGASERSDEFCAHHLKTPRSGRPV